MTTTGKKNQTRIILISSAGLLIALLGSLGYWVTSTVGQAKAACVNYSPFNEKVSGLLTDATNNFGNSGQGHWGLTYLTNSNELTEFDEGESFTYAEAQDKISKNLVKLTSDIDANPLAKLTLNSIYEKAQKLNDLHESLGIAAVELGGNPNLSDYLQNQIWSMKVVTRKLELMGNRWDAGNFSEFKTPGLDALVDKYNKAADKSLAALLPNDKVAKLESLISDIGTSTKDLTSICSE